MSAEPPAEPGVRFIPLTQGMFAKVDESDFADVARWNWVVWKDRYGSMYAIRGYGLSLHRYLMRAQSNEHIDHKNSDGLDNRRDNLRKATPTENNRNRMKLRRSCTSKYKGVSRHCGKWIANIENGIRIRLGRFDTEEEAAHAYDEAARRLHGEFARINFPTERELSALH